MEGDSTKHLIGIPYPGKPDIWIVDQDHLIIIPLSLESYVPAICDRHIAHRLHKCYRFIDLTPDMVYEGVIDIIQSDRALTISDVYRAINDSAIPDP